MPRGGARPGAGRRKGAATKRTRDIADKAAAEGTTPLEVMLGAMRALWEKATEGKTVAADIAKEAAAIAKDAAPYMHPKLTPTAAGGDDEGSAIVIHGGLPDGG